MTAKTVKTYFGSIMAVMAAAPFMPLPKPPYRTNESPEGQDTGREIISPPRGL
jgi:hypothetical protein